MRRLDRFAGVPLCLLMGLAVRQRRPLAGRPQRMLIVKLSEQGATVVAAPALRRAVDLVGRNELYVLVLEENRAILDELQVVDPSNVLTISSRSLPRLLLDTASAVRSCRRIGIDTTVDLEGFARLSAIISVLTGARRRVGLFAERGLGPGRGNLITHRVPDNQHLHAWQVFDVLVATASAPLDTYPVAASPAAHEPAWVPRMRRPTEQELEHVLRVSGLRTEERFVVLHAGAGDLIPLRRWPIERYAEFASRLLEFDPELRIVLTGSSEEARETHLLADSIGSDRTLVLAGATSLRELLVLLSKASLVVTNDSGPSHFASLADTPTITLFGPESPRVFGAIGSKSQAIWSALPCSPCVNARNQRRSPCVDNVCMQTITVDEVAAAAISALT